MAGRRRRRGTGADAVSGELRIVISIFLEKIADIVEAEYYPQLGKAPGISIAAGLWSGRDVPGGPGRASTC